MDKRGSKEKASGKNKMKEDIKEIRDKVEEIHKEVVPPKEAKTRGDPVVYLRE